MAYRKPLQELRADTEAAIKERNNPTRKPLGPAMRNHGIALRLALEPVSAWTGFRTRTRMSGDELPASREVIYD